MTQTIEESEALTVSSFHFQNGSRQNTPAMYQDTVWSHRRDSPLTKNQLVKIRSFGFVESKFGVAVQKESSTTHVGPLGY